jgi:hypothetical protein
VRRSGLWAFEKVRVLSFGSYDLFYSNPFLRQAQDKLAEGDKQYERKGTLIITIITTTLFQIAI